MKIDELKTVLENHLHWIREDCEGWENMHAKLTRANLTGADLTGANLTGADLTGANLTGADLTGAKLTRADLTGAKLTRANLTGAKLTGAKLTGANLTRADLTGANLYGAKLYGADIDKSLIDKFYPICCPEYGAFIAWKKANGMIVKLQIPEDAKRSSAFGRKCRASKAVCLAIENADGTPNDATSIPSGYDGNFIYTVGTIVEVENFDDNRTHECAPGIHFFITRQEAVDYV